MAPRRWQNIRGNSCTWSHKFEIQEITFSCDYFTPKRHNTHTQDRYNFKTKRPCGQLPGKFYPVSTKHAPWQFNLKCHQMEDIHTQLQMVFTSQGKDDERTDLQQQALFAKLDPLSHQWCFVSIRNSTVSTFRTWGLETFLIRSISIREKFLCIVQYVKRDTAAGCTGFVGEL